MLSSLQWMALCQILAHLLIDDVNLDHSVSASLFPCKVTIFPFVVIKYFGGMLLNMQILFLLKPPPHFWHYQWILPATTITIVFASW